MVAQWICDVGNRVHTIVSEPEAMEYFRTMVLNWHKQLSDASEKNLKRKRLRQYTVRHWPAVPSSLDPATDVDESLPIPLPKRALQKEEIFALLAAIHDRVMGGHELIDPWRASPCEEKGYADQPFGTGNAEIVRRIGAHGKHALAQSHFAKLIHAVGELSDADRVSVEALLNSCIAELTTQLPVGRPNGNGASKGAGRTVDSSEHANRKLVAERWDEYQKKSKLPKIDGCRRGSYEHFAAWAVEEYDDMPTNDPEKIRKMIEAHRATPEPKHLKAGDEPGARAKRPKN